MSDVGNLPPIESRFSRSWMFDTEFTPTDQDGFFNPDCLSDVNLPKPSLDAVSRIAMIASVDTNPYIQITPDVDDEGVSFFIIEVEIPHDDHAALIAFAEEDRPEIII